MENYFKRFLSRNILFTHEVAEKLNVSRQRVSMLNREGELVPIKNTSNGAVYLLQDVLQYMEKKGISPKYENPNKPKYICNKTYTDQNVLYAKKYIKELGNIERVSIFNKPIDAAIENYFLPLEEYRYGELINLYIPQMIIHDSDGNQMWLNACNCGYLGKGTRGTEELLQDIGIPQILIESIFENTIVKYVRNEDGVWEVNVRNSDFRVTEKEYTYADTKVNIYWHQGRLSLLQAKTQKSNLKAILNKYWAFIPHPVEYILFSNDEQAIDNGFFDPSVNTGYTSGAYKIILRDYSGRQLWLDIYMEKGKPLGRQSELRNILDMCGFEKIEDNKLSDWFGLLLNRVEITTGTRKPF